MNATLNYPTARINQNFRIKAAGIDPRGRKINTLVGVSGLVNLIGVEFANKFLNRAYNGDEDVCVCKLRRGIKVSLYWK